MLTYKTSTAPKHRRSTPGWFPSLRQTDAACGPERMFWGTDITRLRCSWQQCVTLSTEELPWLMEHDKELVVF